MDASNLIATANRKKVFVNIRRMCAGISEQFELVEKAAFLQPWLTKLGTCLFFMGFETQIREYNADAAIGAKAGFLIKDGIEAIIICSMDGDFAAIEEIASGNNVDVFYVGFQDSFSLLLRNKNLILLEDLECLEEKHSRPEFTENECVCVSYTRD